MHSNQTLKLYSHWANSLKAIKCSGSRELKILDDARLEFLYFSILAFFIRRPIDDNIAQLVVDEYNMTRLRFACRTKQLNEWSRIMNSAFNE